MSLADEALIAQQLPALHAVLADLPENTTPQAALTLIIEALEAGHYPRAMQRINAFLAAQAALVVYLDEELACRAGAAGECADAGARRDAGAAGAFQP